MSFLKLATPLYLKGPEIHLPERVVTNELLVEWMGAKIRPSWIEHRTGIRERRWVTEDQACSDLASLAGAAILSRFPGESVKQLILCTISGDYPTPPTSPLVQERLRLQGIGAFDLGAACAGFVTGLHVGTALSSAIRQSLLLISADVRSKFLAKDDLAATALFGDGAAAAILSQDPRGASFRILATQLFSDGTVADLISIAAGGSRLPNPVNTDPQNQFLKMKKGATLFLRAAEGMTDSALAFLGNLGLTPAEVDWLVPHQANLHLIRELPKKLGMPPEKMIETVQDTGNTSGASVGIALERLKRTRDLIAGQKVLLLAAGGGGLAACALLEVCADEG